MLVSRSYISSLGYRGRELTPQSGGNVSRVLLLGDSIAFSQGVAEGETLADQLAARLNQKASMPHEVVSLGVPGWNTCEELASFRSRGVTLGAQVAVLLYVDNDTEPSPVQVNSDRIVTADVRTGPLGDLTAWLRKSSFSYNYLWSHWQVIKAHSATIDEYALMLARRFDDANPKWQASRTCLVAMVDLAKAHSIRLIVLPFPELFGLPVRPFPFQGYIEKICSAARSAGAECLDLVRASQVHGLRPMISEVEHHPSAQVYAKIADQIARKIDNPPPVVRPSP